MAITEAVHKKPNAQKWPAEVVSCYLDEIEKEARYGDKPFLGKILEMQGLGKHVWSYWKRIFSGNEDILHRMMMIDSVLEVKVYKMALGGQLDFVIARRTLNCVYKWGKRERGEETDEPKDRYA